jgi:hypothetical protein
MIDPVLATDPVEQHLAGLRPGVLAGELATVVGQDLLGQPEPAQGLGERPAHRRPGRPGHHGRDHRISRMVIDPGDQLRLTAIE